MRHTVRRSPRGAGPTPANGPGDLRATAGTSGNGAASGAAPARCVLTATRISHKVPERTSDSGP